MPKYVPKHIASGVEAIVITEDIGVSLELLVRARIPFRCDGDEPTNSLLNVAGQWVAFDEQTVVVLDPDLDDKCYSMSVEEFERVYQLA